VTNLLLFFHLLGALCFFAGGAVVGVLQLAATRQERPSQVHAFLRLAPFGAALVGAGALLTLGFGIALAEHEGLGLSPAWIQAALGLWVAAMVLGAYGGRTARRARHLAQKLTAEGDEPSQELRALVSARGPLWASYASFALLLVIVVLMVWQPGAREPASAVAIPKTLQQQILRSYPQFAYAPTRLPAGVEYSWYRKAAASLHFNFIGQRGQDSLSFEVGTGDDAACTLPPSGGPRRGVVTVNGYRVGWARYSGFTTAWRCLTHGNGKVILLAQVEGAASGLDPDDLVRVVASAEPIR
jgi:uncharacterized membrane protein